MNKFLIILLFFFSPLFVSAQVGSLNVWDAVTPGNFGGIVAMAFPCTATASYLMYVVDLREVVSIGGLKEVSNIKNVADLKKFKPNVFKRIMVFPFTFSRINLNYSPFPGNYVLGTYIDVEVFKSKLGKTGLQKMGLKPEMGTRNYDPVSSCLIGVCPLCWPTPGVSAEGVLTPTPFSGMGTSLIPATF